MEEAGLLAEKCNKRFVEIPSYITNQFLRWKFTCHCCECTFCCYDTHITEKGITYCPCCQQANSFEYDLQHMKALRLRKEYQQTNNLTLNEKVEKEIVTPGKNSVLDSDVECPRCNTKFSITAGDLEVSISVWETFATVAFHTHCPAFETCPILSAASCTFTLQDDTKIVRVKDICKGEYRYDVSGVQHADAKKKYTFHTLRDIFIEKEGAEITIIRPKRCCQCVII